MEKIKFPYRSDGHLALLHVIHESGAWEKHGLDVENQPAFAVEPAFSADAGRWRFFESSTCMSGVDILTGDERRSR
jgi:hypothetical protein